MSSVVLFRCEKYKHWTIKPKLKVLKINITSVFVYFETKSHRARFTFLSVPSPWCYFHMRWLKTLFQKADADTLMAATKSSIGRRCRKSKSSASSYVSHTFRFRFIFFFLLGIQKVFSFWFEENISHQKVNQTQNAGLNNSKLSK